MIETEKTDTMQKDTNDFEKHSFETNVQEIYRVLLGHGSFDEKAKIINAGQIISAKYRKKKKHLAFQGQQHSFSHYSKKNRLRR